MIKAITFDLDGVYFPNGSSNFIKSLAQLGISASEAIRVFKASPEMNNLYKTGKWNDQQFWGWAINEWQLNKSAAEMIELLISGYDIDQRVVDVIKNIRQHGYQALICSNNFPARVNGLQKRFSFLDNFDIKVFSYEVGFIKPAKEIYEILIKQSNVLPEEIFMADDYKQALDVAKSLNIQTHFYTGFDEFLSTLRSLIKF